MSAAEQNYRSGWRSITRAYYTQSIDFLQAQEQAWSLIGEGLRDAWNEGLAEIGIQPDEMTEEEALARDRMIFEQTRRVGVFLRDINRASAGIEGSLEGMLARANIWGQRYNEARERAKSMADANPKLVWVYGDTVAHCEDCATVEGRVYRKDTWDRYGWQPGSRALACGGWQCDCRRVQTDAPCTPGRPPSIQGG